MNHNHNHFQESNLSEVSLNTPFFPTQKSTFAMDPISTLDESLLKSLSRDLLHIWKRLRYVLLPVCWSKKDPNLRSWDLWGPLLFCLLLSYTLSAHSNDSQASQIFATVFTLVWLGSVVVTVNAQLLGSPLWFFHSVSTLGYSLFPLLISALFCVFCRRYLTSVFSMVIISVGFVWSFKAAHFYMGHLMREDTKGLALYPVLLFYIYLSFFIFEMTLI